jgi:hypothetical protein
MLKITASMIGSMRKLCHLTAHQSRPLLAGFVMLFLLSTLAARQNTFQQTTPTVWDSTSATGAQSTQTFTTTSTLEITGTSTLEITELPTLEITATPTPTPQVDVNQGETDGMIVGSAILVMIIIGGALWAMAQRSS